MMQIRYIRFIIYLIPSILVVNYILNICYIKGSVVCDTGWFTYLITNSTSIGILNPIKDVFDPSYLSTHISLFYFPLSLLYQPLSSFISPTLYFAIFIASFYSLISISIFIAGEKILDIKKRYILLFLIFISILTPFNGVGLGLIGFPHIEIAIPALILLFLTLYFSGYRYFSYFIFIFLMMIREDAGFHLFSILSLVLIIIYFLKRSIPKDLMTINILALFVSISMIIIQKKYFGGDNALERIYLGVPHFAHLNYNFIIDRLDFILQYRQYIYIPMVALIPLAIWSKNIFLILPIISTAPWFILSIIAINPMPHSLANYYAFPFIVPLSWTLISFLILYKTTNRKVKSYKIIISTLIITLLSILLFKGEGNVDNRPWNRFNLKYIDSISPIETAISNIYKYRDNFGNMIFDEAISSLYIKNLQKAQYGYINHFDNWQLDGLNTVIFYKSSKKIYNMIEKDLPQIKNFYQIKDTDIIVSSEFNLSKMEFLNEK
jgi:hypothetical protein